MAKRRDRICICHQRQVNSADFMARANYSKSRPKLLKANAVEASRVAEGSVQTCFGGSRLRILN